MSTPLSRTLTSGPLRPLEPAPVPMFGPDGKDEAHARVMRVEVNRTDFILIFVQYIYK